jgi:hypothetical protein
VKYTSRLWQKLLHKVEQYLPIKFDYTGAGSRPHPWQIQAQYYTDPIANISYWRASLSPGLVNGFPAKITMQYSDAPLAAQERVRLENIEAKKPAPKKTDRVDIYLDERAAVKLSFRKIGSDADPDSISGDAGSGNVTGVFEKVPDFFKRLGVADANTNLLAEKPETKRLLLACDIVLNQPRVSLTNTISISAASIDTTLVSINPGFLSPTDREATVTALPKYVVPAETTNFADLFFQRFVDSSTDRLHLSTVYLLSPVLPLLDATNLSGWQPFIKYNCHHNLVHATKQIEKRDEFTPLSLVLPFAGGVAQPIFDYILAENNFFAQAALDFYQQRNLAGKFYAV